MHTSVSRGAARVLRFTLIGAAVATLATSAKADALLSSMAGFSSLQFELIDLAPDDGVTPWIRFGDTSSYLYSLRDDVNAEDIVLSQPGQPFGSGEGSALSPDGRLQVDFGPGFLTAQSRIDASQVSDLGAQALENNLNHVPTQGSSFRDSAVLAGTWSQVSNQYGWGWGSPPFMTAPENAPSLWSFTVSPQTKLVIRGHGDMTAQIDETQLMDGSLMDGMRAGLYDVDLSASSSLYLYLLDTEGKLIEELGVGNNVFARLSQEGTFWNNWLSPEPFRSDVLSDNFEMSLVNDQAEAKQVGMYTDVQSSLGVMQTFRTASAVPEPGTWALMGLGLVGISLAGLKRRSASTLA